MWFLGLRGNPELRPCNNEWVFYVASFRVPLGMGPAGLPVAKAKRHRPLEALDAVGGSVRRVRSVRAFDRSASVDDVRRIGGFRCLQD